MAFGGGRADDAAGDFAVEAFSAGCLESFLHASVLAGVESEDGDAAAGIETIGQQPEQRIERSKFFVHFDADGLEDAADGEFAFFAREPL